MDSIKILGGVSLQGNVKIQGSKNGALPILAAVLMLDGETVLHNVPRISDVERMLHILECLGFHIRSYGDGIRISRNLDLQGGLPREAVTGMRSSMYLLGALLGRWGKVSMEYPGGCVIGARPIDLHLEALKQMGVIFRETKGRIDAYVPGRLKGAEIRLSFPSVGATENVLLAGALAEGRTRLYGAAREPEIVALGEFLNRCGARITGLGSDCICIDGVRKLWGCEFTIPGDRIVAGTYMLMTAAAGGCTLLEGVNGRELESVTGLLQKMGCICQADEESIWVEAPEVLKPAGRIVTEVYPGFPTDLQSVATAVALKIPGETLIEERIFENRFQTVPELVRMGADIAVRDSSRICVRGGLPLRGCSVEARELRGGAALIAAGLMAGGETTVMGCEFIDRGYENICKDLRELGARIYRDK